VHENLRMSGAMLSRFDLVFQLADQPDEALDHSLSEHVLALHSGRPPACPAAAMLLGHTPSLTAGRWPCSWDMVGRSAMQGGTAPLQSSPC